jgi:hypothetical protein
MRFNLKQTVMTLAAVLFLGSAMGFASSPAPAPAGGVADTDFLAVHLSGRASTLLTEIKNEAAGLMSNAQTLGTLNYKITWISHATYLLNVKDHINAVSARVVELQRIQPFVSPWQQQAIAELAPQAMRVAVSAQAAIDHLGKNQQQTFAPAYQDHLRIIMGSSEDLKHTVDKFLEYDKAQQKLADAQRELEL